MRICRYDDDRLGLVDGTYVTDVTAALDALPALRWPAPPGDAMIANLDRLRPVINVIAKSSSRRPLDVVRLRSPVANPSKIIAAPVNYAKHHAEAQADPAINFGSEIKTIEHYGLFLKSNTSLIGPAEAVRLPRLDRRVDHEVELAVVMGREGYCIASESALDFVAGYAIGLDMTVRGPEDRSWRKSFDTFSVLGPWLVTADEIRDPGNLDFSIAITGETRQRSNTKALIFDIPRLISYASSAYRLYPGDIIMTGTPEGVGPVAPGDVMYCSIAEIGNMQVAVEAIA